MKQSRPRGRPARGHLAEAHIVSVILEKAYPRGCDTPPEQRKAIRRACEAAVDRARQLGLVAPAAKTRGQCPDETLRAVFKKEQRRLKSFHRALQHEFLRAKVPPPDPESERMTDAQLAVYLRAFQAWERAEKISPRDR